MQLGSERVVATNRSDLLIDITGRLIALPGNLSSRRCLGSRQGNRVEPKFLSRNRGCLECLVQRLQLLVKLITTLSELIVSLGEADVL